MAADGMGDAIQNRLTGRDRLTYPRRQSGHAPLCRDGAQYAASVRDVVPEQNHAGGGVAEFFRPWGGQRDSMSINQVAIAR